MRIPPYFYVNYLEGLIKKRILSLTDVRRGIFMTFTRNQKQFMAQENITNDNTFEH
jgi:hypothetical protein